MDALTWFKSVAQREPATPAPSRADLPAEPRADLPLHLAAARLRPPPAPAGEDEDWGAVIARAKMQAASPRAPRPAPPPLPRHAPAKAPGPPPPRPPRDAWADMPPTPPPLSKISRVTVSQTTHARLDALVGRGHKKAAVARSSFGPPKRT